MPRNGTPSPRTRSVSAPTRSCSTSESMVARAAPTPGRMMRSAVATSSGAVDQACRETEVLERVQHARCVPGAVVDDVDHPRPRVANARTLSSRSIRSPDPSDLLRDAHPPPLPPRAPPRARAPAGGGARRLPPAASAAAAAARPRRRTARPGPPASRSWASRGSLPSSWSRTTRSAAGLAVPRAPAPPCSSSRRCSSREGNRYNVRGDIAFAQSIVETAWFNYPDYGHGPPVQQQLRRHRRVRLVRQRIPVQQRAHRCARAAAAPPQLRRRHLAAPARSPIRRCPSCGGAPRRPRRTTSTTTSPRARRRSGTTWATATGRPRPTTRPSCSSVYNQMLTYSGEAGQCPPDGLLFGPLDRGRALPGEPAAAGARDRHRRRGAGPTCSTATARSPRPTARRSSDRRRSADTDCVP